LKKQAKKVNAQSKLIFCFQILDIFLDYHVKRRQDDPTIGAEMVEIVTGRGRRSENGIAKIKPAVMKRLKKRGIKYVSQKFLRIFQEKVDIIIEAQKN